MSFQIKTQSRTAYISLMSDKLIPSLLTLPIDIFYRILDQLDLTTILLSMQDVCIRINAILNSYYRYQVNFICPFFTFSKNIVHFYNKVCD